MAIRASILPCGSRYSQEPGNRIRRQRSALGRTQEGPASSCLATAPNRHESATHPMPSLEENAGTQTDLPARELLALYDELTALNACNAFVMQALAAAAGRWWRVGRAFGDRGECFCAQWVNDRTAEIERQFQGRRVAGLCFGDGGRGVVWAGVAFGGCVIGHRSACGAICCAHCALRCLVGPQIPKGPGSNYFSDTSTCPGPAGH